MKRKAEVIRCAAAMMLSAALLTGCATPEKEAAPAAAPETTEHAAAAPAERPSAAAETKAAPVGAPALPEGIRVLLDGEEQTVAGERPEKTAGLWVTVTADGRVILELPFEEAHTAEIIQEGAGMNRVVLTGEKVYMEDADCPGQDCVQMGEVTRDNLETRVMGGFFICLPHRLSVEVWEKK